MPVRARGCYILLAMRTLILLISAACLALVASDARPGLSDIHKVYLMPMSSGLDQYLAQHLAAEGVFTVVVDPKQADAVWSERVDQAFGEALQEMLAAAKPAKDKKEAGAEEKEPAPRRSSGRSRGNVFLVAVGSRQVVWSTFHKMEDRSPSGLHRVARDIVKELKKDLGRE